MEMTMTKGFCELNEQEMCEMDGGYYLPPVIVVYNNPQSATKTISATGIAAAAGASRGGGIIGGVIWGGAAYITATIGDIVDGNAMLYHNVGYKAYAPVYF